MNQEENDIPCKSTQRLKGRRNYVTSTEHVDVFPNFMSPPSLMATLHESGLVACSRILQLRQELLGILLNNQPH